MTQLLDLNQKLTTEELEQVKNLAEFLITRRSTNGGQTRRPAQDQKISFEGWAGCLANVEPDKSNKQVVREAWDAVLDKLDRAGT